MAIWQIRISGTEYWGIAPSYQHAVSAVIEEIALTPDDVETINKIADEDFMVLSSDNSIVVEALKKVI